MEKKVLFVVHRDRRKRYRFLYDPLLQSTVFLPILIETHKTGFIKSLVSIYSYRKSNSVLVIFGGDIKNFVVAVCAKLVGIPVLMRLGGLPKFVRLGEIRDAIRSYNFILAVKLSFNHIFTLLVLRMVNQFIIVNDIIKLELSPYHKTISTIPQFIELPTLKEKQKSCEFTLLIVTNLSYSEKYDGVLEVVEYLNSLQEKERLPAPLVLNIVGGGKYLNTLISMISKVDTNLVKVCIHGYIENLKPFYTDADLFIYNSKNDATPNVLLEAMSYGLPLLVNNNSAFESVVSPKGALYFKNQSSFQKNLLMLLEDRQKLLTMSLENRDYVGLEFSKATIRRKIEESLNKMNLYEITK